MLAMDHIVIAVADLQTAARDYAALGFTVAPGGEHAGGVSHNALVIFEDGVYLELIAFKKPVPGWRWQEVFEHAGEGLVDYALCPSDIDATLATLPDAWDAPVDGARLRPDGERLAWRLAHPRTHDLPFLCADVTPRALRVPEGPHRRHPNGATGVAEVTLAVANVEATEARLATLLGTPDGTLGACRFKLVPASTGHLARRGEGPVGFRLSGGAPATFDPLLTHGVAIGIG